MRGQGNLIAGVIVGAGVMYLLDPERGARRRAQLLGEVNDEILHDRVRSAIGRVVTHPGAITVTVSQGRVTLAGNVLRDEVNALITRVERVRGVTEVRNELAMHRTAAGVADLQEAGASPEPGAVRGAWTPTTRLFLGATGGVIALQGARMKGPGGRALTFLGSGLLSRAASRVPPRRLEETSTEVELAPESVASSAPEPMHATKSTAKRRRSRR